MKLLNFVNASALAIVAFCGSPASATSYLVSFSGVVDETFGPFSEVYDGQSFTGSFRFDTNAVPDVDDDGFAIYEGTGGATAIFPDRSFGPIGDRTRYNPIGQHFTFGDGPYPVASLVYLNLSRVPGDFRPPSLAEVTSLPLRYYYVAVGSFIVAGNVQISDVRTVPEPASWAMMIVGFGLVGASFRRRKVAVSFS